MCLEKRIMGQTMCSDYASSLLKELLNNLLAPILRSLSIILDLTSVVTLLLVRSL